MPIKYIFCWILGLFSLDIASKQAFFNHKFLESTWLFEPVFNTGIARGIQISFWIIIPLSFIGLLVFIHLWKKKLISTEIFILLIAGTYGNLFDRIFLGGVRDFIALGNFPVFNLADCYLSFAVIILLRNEIFPCNCTKKP